MKKVKYFLIALLLLTGCNNIEILESVSKINPLNGTWRSVKVDDSSSYIFFEMQVLELLQSNNGVVYGGLLNGSGGYEWMHWWIEYEITTGITDRVNNTFRITILTQLIYLDGVMVRSTGKLEGKIISDSELSVTFQSNEIGRAFQLKLKKVQG